MRRWMGRQARLVTLSTGRATQRLRDLNLYDEECSHHNFSTQFPHRINHDLPSTALQMQMWLRTSRN
eukprot:scaffold147604_cov23-Cyclotella_meneghiniana.AAC.1